MVSKQQLEKFYRDIEKMRLKRPGARISERTNFSKGVVSEILNKKREPSENFLKKFYEVFDVENETQLMESTKSSNYKKAHPISVDELAGVILRTYALQQVSLSVLAELYADKKNSSVTATLSELLKAVEGEEVKMRDAIQAL